MNIIGKEISDTIDGMQINNKERDLYSIMLHGVVFENQKAIYDLVKLGHYGPASALLCVLFEAHVKGIWLYLCATEKQICQFKQDRIKSTSKKTWSIMIKYFCSTSKPLSVVSASF